MAKPGAACRTFRPLAGRAAFWTIVTLLWLPLMAFLIDVALNDRKAPILGPVSVVGLVAMLWFLVSRVDMLWSRLIVSESSIRLRTLVRRIDVSWGDVAQIDVRPLDSRNATVAGLVAGGLFLPGLTGSAGNVAAKLAGTAARSVAPSDTVPLIRVVTRSGSTPIVLIGIYSWFAADELRSLAHRHDVAFS